MRYQVLNRVTGDVQIEAEIDCAENAPMSVKLGLAARWGYDSRANLRGADLSGAYLRGARLSVADLRGADLRGAYLRDAYLRDADLRDAYLRDAYLRDAYLRGARLSGADLSGAYLRGADLSGADLRDADLTPIRDDLWSVLSAAPAEAAGVAAALRAGKVDGSTYQGECACLVGTIANIRHCSHIALGALKPNSRRPIERFFMGINEGDTPETNQISALALEWTEQWIAAMKNAFQEPDEIDEQ